MIVKFLKICAFSFLLVVIGFGVFAYKKDALGVSVELIVTLIEWPFTKNINNYTGEHGLKKGWKQLLTEGKFVNFDSYSNEFYGVQQMYCRPKAGGPEIINTVYVGKAGSWKYAYTAYSVIKDCSQVLVKKMSGYHLLHLSNVNSAYDLAVLSYDERVRFPTINISFAKPEVGEAVILVGYPVFSRKPRYLWGYVVDCSKQNACSRQGDFLAVKIENDISRRYLDGFWGGIILNGDGKIISLTSEASESVLKKPEVFLMQASRTVPVLPLSVEQ